VTLVSTTNTFIPSTSPKNRLKDCHYIRINPCNMAILDMGDYEDGKMIYRINTPKNFRGRGYASTLLHEVLEECDKRKIPLYLEILPSGDMDYSQLMAWYMRCGFVRIDDNLFKREPQ